MIHLIIGNNQPIIDFQIKTIIHQQDPMVFDTIKQPISINDWLLKCTSTDLFSETKGWVLYNPPWFKKEPKSKTTTIENALDTIQEHQIHVVFVLNTIDKRSKAFKSLQKYQPNIIECPTFKDWETDKLKEWILHFAKAEGLSLSAPFLKRYIDTYATQLGIIKKEIEKLSIAILPHQTLTEKDHVHIGNHASGFYTQLSRGIEDGHTKTIIQTIAILMKLKEDPHKIFNQILFNLNQWLPIYIGHQQKKTAKELAAELSKHPYFIQKQLQKVQRNPSAQFFRNWLIFCAYLDQNIKTGRQNAKHSLIWFCNHIKHQKNSMHYIQNFKRYSK